MSEKWMWNGAPGSITSSAAASGRERLDLRVAAVGDRVQVGEVEHGAHPVEPGGDRHHVVERPQLAHPTHALDPERHRAVLALEPLAKLAELLDDSRDRV